MRWDIFCQIVDNYGDAGVCWRLARALSRPSPSSSLSLSNS
ncbi:MAG: elongation factor P maturation arginine rhamnosyltransferase EarP, partial [Polynucleobacter victoriensis]